MGKRKSQEKKKGSQLVIRVDAKERNAFVELCDALDTSAAREIRRFMRGWVAEHSPKPDAGPIGGATLAPKSSDEEIPPLKPDAVPDVEAAAKAKRKTSAKKSA